MIVDNANATASYHRHHNRDICATIKELSPERKRKLLDEIQLQKGACNLFGQNYNHHDYELIEKLLQEETK